LLFAYFLCFVCLQGCFTSIKGGGKNAYKVDINTANIDEARYRSLNLSAILLNRGYKQYWSEKPVSPPDFAGQSGFYSTFGKTITREGYSVDVSVQYAQAEPQSPSKSLHIWVVNWTVGNRVLEVTHEIDEVSNAIYHELIKEVGKENVTLTRHGQITRQ
jgi:hypothetical protein